MKNKNKGITLIALIITIVVLIILAGVALNIALGENGIFTKSKLSADTYVNAAANEVEELQKAESIIDELIESKTDPYNGQATADEVVPQLFMYEIINPATASNEEGVDGITKLADTSEELKIASTSTKPTAKIMGINYDYAFGDLAEYTSNGTAGSGYDSVDDETSQAKFENIVKQKYSKLVIPAKVKLNASGEYDANGTEYTITQIFDLGEWDASQGYVSYAFRENVSEIVLPNTIERLEHFSTGEDGKHYKSAFRGFTKITSINLPKSLKYIAENSFSDCSSLNTITIPNSVTIIGEDAFYSLASGSTIYVESQEVANLLINGTNYNSSNTTVVVDPSKF